MSTWLYLECLDHDPPITADSESGQHLYDLRQIRDDLAHRDALVAAAMLDVVPDDHFRSATVRFLRQHPKCLVGIRDEYGRSHPVIEPAARP